MNELESLYKNAFDNARELSDEQILKGVEKMKAKRAGFRKKTLALLVAACFLMITTTALAAMGIWGDFDWLRLRVGDEIAERLQPIGLGLTYVRTGDIYSRESMATEDIRIEVIAVAAGDYEIDVFLLLEDLREGRLWGEQVMVDHVLWFADPALVMLNPIRGRGHSIEFNVIERNDEVQKAVFHSRMQHPSLPHDADTKGANTRALSLFIAGIIFNFSIYEDVKADINLAELLMQPSPTRVLTHEEARMLGATGNHRSYEAGDIMLVPNSLNFPFEVGGHSMEISAIAVVDGKLHIQIYGGEYVFFYTALVRNGERTTEYFLNKFGLDEYGNFRSIRELDEFGNWLWMGEHQYVEMIFAADIDNLHEYHLEGILIWQDFVKLNWAVSFELRDEVDIPLQPGFEEMIAELDAFLAEIFGDLPRYVYIFDDHGVVVGRLSPSTIFTRSPIHGWNLEIDGVRFTYGEVVLCVRNDFDLLPPELRDEIMYHANKWFALNE